MELKSSARRHNNPRSDFPGATGQHASLDDSEKKSLIKSGVLSASHYEAIIATHDEHPEGQNDSSSTDEAHLYLRVYFSIARVYHKLATFMQEVEKVNPSGSDKTGSSSFARKSIEAFEFYNTYYESLGSEEMRESDESGFREKNEIAIEMAALLRMKYKMMMGVNVAEENSKSIDLCDQ